MRQSEIDVGKTYIGYAGNTRKVLAITQACAADAYVRYKIVTSKLGKYEIGSIHECKLASFATWAWRQNETG